MFCQFMKALDDDQLKEYFVHCKQMQLNTEKIIVMYKILDDTPPYVNCLDLAAFQRICANLLQIPTETL